MSSHKRFTDMPSSESDDDQRLEPDDNGESSIVTANDTSMQSMNSAVSPSFNATIHPTRHSPAPAQNSSTLNRINRDNRVLTASQRALAEQFNQMSAMQNTLSSRIANNTHRGRVQEGRVDDLTRRTETYEIQTGADIARISERVSQLQYVPSTNLLFAGAIFVAGLYFIQNTPLLTNVSVLLTCIILYGIHAYCMSHRSQ